MGKGRETHESGYDEVVVQSNLPYRPYPLVHAGAEGDDAEEHEGGGDTNVDSREVGGSLRDGDAERHRRRDIADAGRSGSRRGLRRSGA